MPFSLFTPSDSATPQAVADSISEDETRTVFANTDELATLHSGLQSDLLMRTKLNEEFDGVTNAIRADTSIQSEVAERTMSYIATDGKRTAGGDSVSKDCLGDIFLHYLQFFKVKKRA